MFHKHSIPIIVLATFALFGCSLTGLITPTANPSSPIPNASTMAAMTVAALPSATSPQIEPPSQTQTPNPTISPYPSSTPEPSQTIQPPMNSPTVTLHSIPNYIDDRSSAQLVIISLYNAINRHEYLRGYSYWSHPANSLGSFSAYANGYMDTAWVDLVFGQVMGDAGMSQVYYTVPVILKVTSTNGNRSNYAACYIVHAVSADVQGVPPYQPMSIDQGSAVESDINADQTNVLTHACDGYPQGASVVPFTGSNLNIDKSNFLDDRSGPIETVSSFLNALNRKQYVRAYYYYQDPASYPGNFSAYAAGYADTDVITVTFGSVLSEGAAGSDYYQVPLALHVLTTSSTKQTFVGCYTLRLSQPSIQAVPPFQPIGITDGNFTQVSNSTDVTSLLWNACK
jgi:hypothetical protein